MCNKLHHNSIEIPDTGTGWKIFQKRFQKSNNELISLVKGTKYKINSTGRIHYNDNDYPDKGDGFCFFLTREEGRKELKEWNEDFTGNVLKKIKYYGGLGCHYENSFIDGTCRIALCEEFEIIEGR